MAGSRAVETIKGNTSSYSHFQDKQSTAQRGNWTALGPRAGHAEPRPEATSPGPRILTPSKEKTNSFWEVKIPRPQHTHTHTPENSIQSTSSWCARARAAETSPGWERSRGGAGAGPRTSSGGAGIWPARPGSPSTLILLSARPGAGLGNVTFQRKLFPFLPRTGKRRKTSKLPVSRSGRQASIWAFGRHVPSPPPPPATPPRVPAPRPTTPATRMPRSDSLTELIPAKDKCISQLIKGGRGVSWAHQPWPTPGPCSPGRVSATAPHWSPDSAGSLVPDSWDQRVWDRVTLDLPCRHRNLCPSETWDPHLLSGAPHSAGNTENSRTREWNHTFFPL